MLVAHYFISFIFEGIMSLTYRINELVSSWEQFINDRRLIENKRYASSATGVSLKSFFIALRFLLQKKLPSLKVQIYN